MGNGASNALRQADAELRAAANPGTSVSLTERQLAAIPLAVFDLPAYRALTSLNISRNMITAIPNELERLTSLTSLFGNTNNLTKVPASVAALRNLTTVSLQRNRITDLTPLMDVPSLTELEMQENALETLPDSLSRLTNLRYLNLNKNRLRALPPGICSMTTLHAINVADNQLASLPEPLSQLQSLRFLVLSNNKMSAITEDMCNLPTIDTVLLDQNALMSVPESVTRLRLLTLMDARMNPNLVTVPPCLHQSLVVYVDAPSPIIPHLFLGPVGASENLAMLRHCEITHVVRAIDALAQPREPFPKQISYLSIDCLDSDTQDMSQYFELSNKFIHDAIAAGHSVLVHCRQGKSRSGTLVLSYLMAHHNYSYSQALAFVRTKRRMVGPNSFFVKQLREYSEHLGRAPDANDIGADGGEV